MIKILTKEQCTGCTACAAACPKSCIVMRRDDEGFLYPYVDETQCIQCNVCEEICPVSSSAPVAKATAVTAYAAVNKNETVRMNSSSGGVFTLIAEYVLDKGGIVFGAALDDELQIEHIGVENKTELQRLQGSKYVQSRIGNTYRRAKEQLKAGRLVLYTGTPCQISGLQAYLRKDYDNLICQDMICHGVPSPAVWERYVAHRQEAASSKAEKVLFRQKRSGWKTYSVQFDFADNSKYAQPFIKDPYMQCFLADLCLRPSCYMCHFKGKHRPSDFTLADFWGIENVLPVMDDDKGTSLVFVHTEKAAAVFEEISNNLIVKQVDSDAAIANNPSMLRSSARPANRERFMRDIRSDDFGRVVNKYCRGSYMGRIERKVKSVLKKILRKP